MALASRAAAHAFFLRSARARHRPAGPSTMPWASASCRAIRHARWVRYHFERALDELGWRSWVGAKCPRTTAAWRHGCLRGASIWQSSCPPGQLPHQVEFERRLFVARKFATRTVRESVKAPGSSTLLDVLGGRSSTRHAHPPGAGLLPDLGDESFESAWPHPQPLLDEHAAHLAAVHPFRTLAHNGEINTLRGNVN